MKAKIILSIFLLFSIMSIIRSQDTFSIVALDSVTGEVGSAGASCVDMDNFPNYDDDFLGELFPGQGAINTQAWYEPENQANARARMKMGDTPDEIIHWLIENDVTGQPERRQYGIVALVEFSPQSAAFTGEATNDYKGHILGPNYSIQGNILLGQEILDSMEARFLNAPGDLACKLMAALQGANVVGADTRCAPNGTSSLFAFVKVAQPSDTFGNPSLVVSLRTKNGQGIEPIDSLQTLFDLVHDCPTVGITDNDSFESNFLLYPNPADDLLILKAKRERRKYYDAVLMDATGKVISRTSFSGQVKFDVSAMQKGIYFVRLYNEKRSFIGRFIKK